MINNRNILNEVELSLTAEKNQREFELDLLEKQLLENKNYSITVNKLATLEFDLQKAIFLEDKNLTKTLETQIAELKTLREKMRNELGFNSTNVPSLCPICNGSGRVENNYCKCFI